MDELDAAIDLGPENEQQLAHLRRALVLGSGFQLVLLEVSHPGLRSEALRRLLGWSGHGGVPTLAVVKTRPGRDPVAALQGVTAGAVLVGIDQPFYVDHDERSPTTADDSIISPADAVDPVERSMTTLNWYRDELPLLVQGPLVVMLSPDGLRRLFVHAPDLLAWRAHTTRVTTPRPVDLEVRPWPSRRASLEEKTWLERMIARGPRDPGGPLAHVLPGWLIRLGEIEAREGGPWQQSFARAEELAAGRHDLLFRLELARARRALDDGRYEDARAHEDTATRVSDAFKNTWASISGGWISLDGGAAELRVVRAERLLRLGEVEQATEVAETALRSAHASGDLALVIAAKGLRGAVASHRGDHLEATSLFGEVHEIARLVRDPAVEVFALTWLIELAPDVEHARALHLQAMELTDDQDHEARARAGIALARHELLARNPERAERVLSELAPLADLQPRTRIRVLIARGATASARDQHDAALAAYRMAWDEQERTSPSSWQHARIGLQLGEAALRAGEVTVARDTYGRVAEIADALADGQLAAAARAGLDRALPEVSREQREAVH